MRNAIAAVMADTNQQERPSSSTSRPAAPPLPPIPQTRVQTEAPDANSRLLNTRPRTRRLAGAAACAWAVAGLGLMVVLYVNTTAYGKVEGLAYLGAAMLLLHAPTLRKWAFGCLFGGAVAGAIDTMRLFADGPSFNLLVWLTLEAGLGIWALLAFPPAARGLRRLLPQLPDVVRAPYDHPFELMAQRSPRSAAHMTRFAWTVIVFSAFYVLLDAVVILGAEAIGRWAGTFLPIARDTVLNWFVPTWLSGTVSHVVFALAAVGVLCRSTLARGCLLVLAGAKTFDWAFDITDFEFGLVTVLAVAFWLWGFLTLLPAGAVREDEPLPGLTRI